MICNKCGKNNPAGIERCPACGEEMPGSVNCGGFSDILTYTPAAQPEETVSAGAAPAMSAKEEGRRKMEIKASSERSKKAVLYSLVAMGVSIITLICVIICLIKVATMDYVPQEKPDSAVAGEVTDDIQDESKKKAEEYTIDVKILPDPGAIGDGVETVEIVFKKADNAQPMYSENVTLQEFSEGRPIVLKDVKKKDFPLKVDYNGEEQEGRLVLKDNKVIWEASLLDVDVTEEEKDNGKKQDKPKDVTQTPPQEPVSEAPALKVAIIDLSERNFSADKPEAVRVHKENGERLRDVVVNGTVLEVTIESNADSMKVYLESGDKKSSTFEVSLTPVN